MRAPRLRGAGLALVGLLLGACADEALLAEGAPCSASAECGPGLLCDLGKKVPVCAPTGTIARDLAVAVSDGGGSDLSASDDLATSD